MDAAPAFPTSVSELQARLATFPPPTLIDVRAADALTRDPQLIAGAPRRDAAAVENWSRELEPWRPVVIYCAHGHERSQRAAAALRAHGFDATHLAGGFDAWRAAGGALEPARAPTRWVTRERPKIDRIACPWLIRRFLDPAAEFFYVPVADVRTFAAANAAEPYDIPDVKYSHVGPQCSFDAFIRIHGLRDGALDDLVLIVRGADTAALQLAPQAPGLVAASRGLSRMFGDDHAMLHWGMLLYDSLYAWCREARGETREWNPARIRAPTAERAA
jgi:rhodanese-related sulfurtransferase